ncbi:hypothetical protein PAECIP111893_02216 [Paenibacillus plantiphilus]|uniref:YetF C-terminal domain-containing protein n=2 Tax=Paenibacillus plantiphilus TaxID=2905650 RepID=A0ABM9C622_9BACL|nr:DUF421 domain-containing protein [Paenibacillus plantiphilus]CAH1204296.1 hypothetical protein PAECIP111893_02216 [Paenibacillus plantiphilus]
MELWILLFRTVLIYFVVFLIMRSMGKREIGKLSVFDLVISFMIAEIAVMVIEDTNRPMIEGILPMVVLLIIQIALAYLALKSRKLRFWFDGKPTVMIERGKLNREAMHKQRYNLDDLLQQLRENQVSNVADVEFAILETTGSLSVITKEQSSGFKATSDSGSSGSDGFPAQQKSDKSGEIASVFPRGFRFETLPVPLIMDGKVQGSNLLKLGKNRFWLNEQLREKGIADYRQVYMCTIDHKGNLFIDTIKKPGY